MISERLKIISSFIDSEDKLADIGCDHGYLGKLAIDKGVKTLQLIDNKIGPLNKAKENIKNDNVIFTLSSGLDDLISDIDTIAICGMGGDLIISLLDCNYSKAKKLKKIILQPNRNEKELRDYLSSHYYIIEKETIIYEKNKYYEVIACRFLENTPFLTKEEIEFGPILMKEKSSTFINKWNSLLTHYLSLYNNHPTIELDNKINLIKSILK